MGPERSRERAEKHRTKIEVLPVPLAALWRLQSILAARGSRLVASMWETLPQIAPHEHPDRLAMLWWCVGPARKEPPYKDRSAPRAPSSALEVAVDVGSPRRFVLHLGFAWFCQRVGLCRSTPLWQPRLACNLFLPRGRGSKCNDKSAFAVAFVGTAPSLTGHAVAAASAFGRADANSFAVAPGLDTQAAT